MKQKTTTVVEHAGTGYKMPESLARQIDALTKGLPKEFGYRRVWHKSEEFKLDTGSRTDVAYITTDDLDRQNEVALPGGMDAKDYDRVVTAFHDYSTLQVGVNQWMKQERNGVLAKTFYHTKPKDWSADWLPDAILSIQNEGGMRGKSIGFIPLNARKASTAEIDSHPEWKDARCVYDRWKILEYACCTIPCNPAALTVAVSKSVSDPKTRELIVLSAKEFDASTGYEPPAEPQPVAAKAHPSEIQKAITRRVKAMMKELPSLIRIELRDSIDRATGRV